MVLRSRNKPYEQAKSVMVAALLVPSALALAACAGGGGGSSDVLMRILHVGRQDNSNQLSSYVICLPNCSGRALVALSPKGT